MSDIIHYYNMWNEYAYLIPIISVLIVGVLVLWCCICPVYRCFVKPLSLLLSLYGVSTVKRRLVL